MSEIKYHTPGKLYLRWIRLKMLHWTKCAFARLSNGEPTFPKDPNAVQWDLAGAIRKLPGIVQWELEKSFLPYTKNHLCVWNDFHIKSNKDVINVINMLLIYYDIDQLHQKMLQDRK